MFNSSALFSIGPQVEDIFGSQKFVFIYIGTGIASGIASYLFLPAGSAGASGAIFGLIGLMAVYGYRLGGSFGRGLMRQMLIWAVVGIMFGFFIGANNVAHVGGFVAGGALGFVLAPDAPTTIRSSALWNAAAIASVGLVAISFTMAGVNYGAAQESEEQARRKRLEVEAKWGRGEDVILLAQRIREAERLVFDQDDSNSQTSRDPKEISKALKAAALDIKSAPEIDERSTGIRNHLVEQINKRANLIETGGRGLPDSAKAAFSDLRDLRDC